MAIRRIEKEFPEGDANLGGNYARDTHRGGFGDDYAREGAAAGTAARGDTYGSTARPRKKRGATVKPKQSR